eukprot:jgi/Chrzof1/11684/Cz06g05100.t1
MPVYIEACKQYMLEHVVHTEPWTVYKLAHRYSMADVMDAAMEHLVKSCLSAPSSSVKMNEEILHASRCLANALTALQTPDQQMELLRSSISAALCSGYSEAVLVILLLRMDQGMRVQDVDADELTPAGSKRQRTGRKRQPANNDADTTGTAATTIVKQLEIVSLLCLLRWDSLYLLELQALTQQVLSCTSASAALVQAQQKLLQQCAVQLQPSKTKTDAAGTVSVDPQRGYVVYDGLKDTVRGRGPKIPAGGGFDLELLIQTAGVQGTGLYVLPPPSKQLSDLGIEHYVFFVLGPTWDKAIRCIKPATDNLNQGMGLGLGYQGRVTKWQADGYGVLGGDFGGQQQLVVGVMVAFKQ